ncbi:hypothetical protein KPZU09_28580 [Klebsiella pneumoniae]|uniref:HTH lysR-type domain-containing protein n=1 Tax=Klebsiella pneumoniae TaxID=573 RepID=A0A919HSX1_KLEPN|nr:hypothetical protein KPZU09_28580 [Klebsiella pneumoniae]
MQAEILLTLKLQQRLFADPRRIALLKQIDQTGSISQGAKHAGISYKSAWDAINEMNQLSEQPLVDRATGGKGGGGAVLTRYGQRLIQLYDLLAQIQQKAFDVLSDDDALPLDSLLAAISRFPCRPAPATSGSAPLPAAIASRCSSTWKYCWLTEKPA